MGKIEVMNLNSTIKEKDTKIAALQSELVGCKKEITALKEQVAKSGEGLVGILGSIGQKSATLEKENAALRARIKELEK